jgi:hypothetical protein
MAMLQSVVKLKISGALWFLARVTRNRGRVACVTPPFGVGRLVVMFYIDNVVIYLLERHSDVL